jgi:hypothetical protein
MKKRLFILLAIPLVFLPAPAHADTLNQARLDAIRQRCAVIQTTLDQLQRRDLVARTNRGRAYEAQIKQIDSLATRLRNNDIAAPMLEQPTARLKVVVESFRVAYVAYDDRMTDLRETDCRNQSQVFALKLEELKVMRQVVGVEVTKGEEALAQYRLGLLQLRESLADGKKETD